MSILVISMILHKLHETIDLEGLKNHTEVYKWEGLFSLIWSDIENHRI